MTKYQIVLGRPEQLTRKVDKLIQDGWNLQGGVSVTDDSKGYVFAQAMIREVEIPELTHEDINIS